MKDAKDSRYLNVERTMSTEKYEVDGDMRVEIKPE